jgi:hypothetical protein
VRSGGGISVVSGGVGVVHGGGGISRGGVEIVHGGGIGIIQSEGSYGRINSDEDHGLDIERGKLGGGGMLHPDLTLDSIVHQATWSCTDKA